MITLMTVFMYLSLADVIHCSRAKWQPDILHFAGLEQVVAVTALLLQFGLNGSHLLLKLGQLPGKKFSIKIANWNNKKGTFTYEILN